MSTVTSLDFKEKDTDDNEPTLTSELRIEVVENGWLVTITNEDEEEVQHVFEFPNGAQMIAHITEALGAASGAN